MRDRDSPGHTFIGSVRVIFDIHGLLDYLGAYLGVDTFHSCGKNQHLGAYPGVDAHPGDYGTCT